MPDTFTFDVPLDDLAAGGRIEALEQTGLLGVRHDQVLDRLTRLVQWGTGAPVALVTMVTSDRQVFASARGLSPTLESARQTPLEQSFCQYVVVNDAPLVVTDARIHPHFSTHPGLLVDDVVAYAGHPVRHPDGWVLGTICAADSQPRRWSDADLAALADLAVLVETTIEERVRRHVAQRRRQQLEHVVHGATTTAIIATDADGVVTFANASAHELVESAAGQLEGTRLDEVTESWQPLDGTATPDGSEDWLVPSRGGQQRAVTVRRTPLPETPGHPSGVVLVCDDVSTRVRAQELLSETLARQEQLVRHMKRLDRERDVFVATASHELRTPVTSILGYTELLMDGAADTLGAEQLALLEPVHRSSRRLLHLVDDLLALSRPGVPEQGWARIEVDRLVGRAVEAVGPLLTGRDLVLDLDVPEGPVVLRGSAVEIERVALNLLTNAIKFTPDGGRIDVAVRRGGGRVELAVADTGVGLEPEERDRVFEPFWRAPHAYDQAVHGTGLGLTLVQQLVGAHGGEVELTSAPGRGTTVLVRLPVG